ncbi:MAG: hypothetical protein LYZ70_01575 [Nitrososphaerales archaeon]|nr:hypothetical protein [Nitrososphaerales archaeon]
MSNQELGEFLARVEARYARRLLRAWQRDPEDFPEYVRQLEEIIDLRRKISG